MILRFLRYKNDELIRKGGNLLPDNIDIGYRPVDDIDVDSIEFYLCIDDKQFLSIIGKQILQVKGGHAISQVKIKPEVIIITFPDVDVPYRIEGLSKNALSIKLRKE